MSWVGGLYRNLDEKHDSAVIYLQSAVSLAREQKNDNFYFVNNFALSEYYSVREKDYRAAIRYGRQALSVGASSIEHPRVHYRLAESYTHLGLTDSAQYYMANAPKMTSATDSIVYYNVMSQIAQVRHDPVQSKRYMEMAHAIADSVTIHGLNERLLAIEKKYDLQQEELKNSQLRSRLLGTWLMLLAIAIVALLLTAALLRYRRRLRIKSIEQEMIRDDLESSRSNLQQMQARLENYEKKLHASEMACSEQMASNTMLEQERQQLSAALGSLDEKKRQSDELRAIITQQIASINQLMSWSDLNADLFVQKFRETMTFADKGNGSYWAGLHPLVNELHDNVLIKAQDAAGGSLSDNDLNLLALYCCGFSRSAIMMAMGYKNIGSVYNKTARIARKIGVSDLSRFVNGTHA